MSYIQSIVPLKGFRLYMKLESGGSAMIDLSSRLHTAKYAELADEAFFKTAVTDGDYVIWGAGRLRLTVNELLEVLLLG